MVLFKQYFEYSVQIKNQLQKAFTVSYWQFFDETNFFEPNEHFFQKFGSSLEVQRGKKNSNNLGQNCLELYNALKQTRLPQVKRNVITSKAKMVYECPHELLNDLVLRMLGNKEILRKCQIRVETQSSAQPPLDKFNFGSSSQRKCKSRCQTFLVLCNFTGFLNFIPNNF